METLTVYLDTHVIVLALGPAKRFPRRALALMRGSHSLKVSPAVLLELQFLREIGRVHAAPRQLVELVSEAFPISICDRPFAAVAEAACDLAWTRDPFDRMIVAQAALSDCALLSKDQNIRAHYANARWD